jgi:hypothetical protein
VAAGDAAGKVVLDVKDDAVAVGHLAVEFQDVFRNGAPADAAVQLLQQCHSRFRPYAPMTEQSAQMVPIFRVCHCCFAGLSNEATSISGDEPAAGMPGLAVDLRQREWEFWRGCTGSPHPCGRHRLGQAIAQARAWFFTGQFSETQRPKCLLTCTEQHASMRTPEGLVWP